MLNGYFTSLVLAGFVGGLTATKSEVLDLLGSLSDNELGTIKAVIAALRGQSK